MARIRFSFSISVRKVSKPTGPGSVLDRVETVLKFAESLTFKGNQPVVTLVEKVYETGVKLTSKAMNDIEKQINRLPELPKWFVEIKGNSRE